MTTVKMWEDENKAGLSLEGHAGTQTVCAALSMLTEAMINTLYTLGTVVQYKAEPGKLTAEYERRGKKHDGLRADGAYKAAKVGIEMLAQAYPDEVKIEK